MPKDARQFWETSVVRLVEVGIVDRVDVPALEMLAVQYARWRQAGRSVARKGLFAVGSRGQPRESPAVKVEREAHMVFLRTAEHFALTPVARARLGLAEVHRRSLEAEMSSTLDRDVVDGDVIDDDGDAGVPGL